MKRRFQLVLIKPSRYDDEGYVVQKSRSSTPANSLACIYALALDAAERQVLGPDVAIDITALDEGNTRFRAREIIAQFARHDGFGVVGLVGVQSSQFPRALDIARPLRGADVPVVIGGFVSGDLGMLPDMQTDLRQALDIGCSVFAGDAENGRIDPLIRDAANGALQSIYNHVDRLPALESAPSPFLPPEALKRMIDHYASFDAGRGCPFQCSFCTIIDVQGRRSCPYSADDAEQSIRAHHREGVPWFFITDENFARTMDWEAIFDRIILLRERDRIELNIVIQVDPLCHEIPNFVAKAVRAGVRKIFATLERIDPGSMPATKKHQNKVTEYHCMMLAWKKAGVATYEGHIFRCPNSASKSACGNEQELATDSSESFCYAAASSKIRRARPMRVKRPAAATDKSRR